MQNNSLFEFDPEMERTFHKLKMQTVFLTTSAMAGGEEAHRQTLRDYVTPGAQVKPRALQYPLLPPIILSLSWRSSLWSSNPSSAAHQ